MKFVAGGEAANLTASAGIDVSATTGIGGLDISPDGTRIAVMAKSRGSSSPFATWEIPAPLPGLPRKLLDDGFLGMRWAPDGRAITFIRAGAAAGDALWVADADGANRREILCGERRCPHPLAELVTRWLHLLHSHDHDDFESGPGRDLPDRPTRRLARAGGVHAAQGHVSGADAGRSRTYLFRQSTRRRSGTLVASLQGGDAHPSPWARATLRSRVSRQTVGCWWPHDSSFVRRSLASG